MLFWQVIIEIRLVTDFCASMYTQHCSSRSTFGDAQPQAHVVIASQHTWKTRKRERAISLGDRLFRMLPDAQSGSQDKPAIYTHVRGRPPAQDNLQLAR